MQPQSQPIAVAQTVAIQSLAAAAVVPKEDDEVTSSDADLMKLPTSMETFGRLDAADAVVDVTDVTAKSIGGSGEDAVFESAAKLLFLAVKWAKSMASFAQLPLDDQTRLLEESWAELFVVTAVQYGLAAESELGAFKLTYCS